MPGNGVTAGIARSLHGSAVPFARNPCRPTVAPEAVRVVGTSLQLQHRSLPRTAMRQEPPLRINLFPETTEDAKDWYGFLNIKKDDIPKWIEVLENPENLVKNSVGSEEVTICVVGFNANQIGRAGGIRIEQRLGRKQVHNGRRGERVTH